MPLVKKKNGHSPVCEEPLEPEATLHAGRTEPSPSPRKQALGPCKSLNGEKRKSMSPGLRVKTSPDPKQVEEVSELARSSKNTRRRKTPRKLQPSQPGTLGSERSGVSSPRKESKKKPVKVEAPEYIPIGDGPKVPVKKKMKSKKKAEQADTEQPALKWKKRQESRGGGEPWDEEPNTDLEVVLEKKGNMDKAHIGQVRPGPHPSRASSLP
ncbi:hypothetical protein J1605_018217 [Eschrichtius robustus]|uniref:Uncharacterized protein n=1 Tax=Eschrichtius robustus TaxID=9764 RepID=A0AB34I0D0_ESCRO|nr:hypothetical protein J1605_018217 [Eschrichtius robustus]